MCDSRTTQTITIAAPPPTLWHARNYYVLCKTNIMQPNIKCPNSRALTVH